MSFKFEVKGVNRVRNNLRRLVAMQAKVIQPVGNAWAESTRKKLKSTKYPPKRPGQKYKRTGRLASSWAVSRSAGRWTFVNQARQKGVFYAGYVVGKAQAWMHAGRWWQAHEVIEKEIPKLTKALTAKIEELWNG